MNIDQWHKQAKADHYNTLKQLNDFALKCFPEDTGSQQDLYRLAIEACYQAHIFSETFSTDRRDRQNDRDFLKEKESAISALNKLSAFMERHHKRKTPALEATISEFFYSLQDEKAIRLQPLTGKRPCYDILTETLQTLKETLSEDHRHNFLYRHKYGCFVYPDHTYDASLPTPPRMLAVYLVGLFRLASSGQMAMARQDGWEMPTAGTGEPRHELVNYLVGITFPEDGAKINSQGAEADFREKSPGIKMMSW